ncbi:MAG: SOS response-associated peptidase [bacterium]
MCGRFALSAKTDEIEKLLPELYSNKKIKPSYNIAPTQEVAIVINKNPKEITFAHWGLIPSWAKDKSIGNKMINARAETLQEKATFKNLFSRKRCLIIADGFFEWKKVEGFKRKTPYFIKMKTGEPFTFAGLWDTWKNPENEMVTSTVIITTEPNAIMQPIHNRMPVIILPEERKLWLTEDIGSSDLAVLLKPYTSDSMLAYQVSDAVNSPGNNSPLNIEQINSHIIVD